MVISPIIAGLAFCLLLLLLSSPLPRKWNNTLPSIWKLYYSFGTKRVCHRPLENIVGFEVSATKIACDQKHVRDYERLIGGAVPNLPVVYPQILGFRLQLLILGRPEFPFPVNGSVHVRNIITLNRWIERTELLNYRTTVSNVRHLEEGNIEFDLTTVCSANELTETVFSNVATFLIRNKKQKKDKKDKKDKKETEPLRSVTYEETWAYSSQLSRNYAWLSGDYNPIHLWPLTAKLFGFQSNIMHGMYSIGKLCGLIHSKSPQTDYFSLKTLVPPIQIKTSFLKPILLPATVKCKVLHNPSGFLEYQMCDNQVDNKIYIEGDISAL